MISITLLIIGIIFGILSYNTYLAGRPAHLQNSRHGTKYVTEITAGDSDYKNAAIAGFKIALTGLVLSGICFGIKQTSKTKKNKFLARN